MEENKGKKLVSIVIPIFNKGNVLERCLKSILECNLKDYEVILVNDGSSDNSYSICKEWSDRDKNFILVDKENGGVSDARNVGLSHATGEYVTFVDPDDYINFKLYNEVVKSADGVDAIFFGWEEKRGDMIVSKDYGLKNCMLDSSDDVLKYVLHPWSGYRGYVWNKWFKTDLVKDVRFDTNISHAEDLLWVIEACKKIKNIKLMDAAIYVHEIYEDSLSQFSKLTQKRLEIFDIRERIINSLSGNDKKVAMMAYHWELLNFLNRELYNGDNDSVNLVMSKYNKIYEKEYYNWVSIKQKIKNILMINSGKNYKRFSFNKVILTILK